MQKHKFKFIRGDDVSYRLFFRKKDGTPANLAGVKFDLHALEEGNALVITLSSDKGDIDVRDDGEVILTFSHHHTAKALWERASYDLQLTDVEGKRRTLLYGEIQLIHDKTQV